MHACFGLLCAVATIVLVAALGAIGRCCQFVTGFVGAEVAGYVLGLEAARLLDIFRVCFFWQSLIEMINCLEWGECRLLQGHSRVFIDQQRFNPFLQRWMTHEQRCHGRFAGDAESRQLALQRAFM